VAESARHFTPNNTHQSHAKSKDQLQTLTHTTAIEHWQDKWSTAPHLQPAYLALPFPPNGRIPPFVKGLATHPHSIFCTGIRLLTTHAFTGEYSARFRPTANDPLHCECGNPLQLAHHVIVHCPCYTEARSTHLTSSLITTSLSSVFGTKKGGATLGAFIAATQACIRLRCANPAPEDHR